MKFYDEQQGWVSSDGPPTLKVRRVRATLEEVRGDLHIIIVDDCGNEMVLRAQCTSADRIRIEAISKVGLAHIDQPEPVK